MCVCVCIKIHVHVNMCTFVYVGCMEKRERCSPENLIIICALFS